MMTNKDKCPECGSYDTETVHSEFRLDTAEQVRICNGCPTQYTVEYGNPIIEVDDV